MNTRGKRYTWLILGLILIAAISYLVLENSTKPSPPANLAPLRLALDSQAVVSMLPVIAENKGFWNAEGLKVEVQRYSSGREAAQALLGGKADIATMADFPFVLASIQQNPNLRAFATIARSDTHIQILGNQKSGVTSPSNLKGKRIGVTAGTAGQYALDRFLRSQQLSTQDYQLITLAPPELATAAIRPDTLDAVCTWQPFLFRIRSGLGADAVQLASGIYDMRFLAVGDAKLAASQPESLHAFIRGLRKAEALFKDNPQEVVPIVSAATSLEPDVVSNLLKEYRFVVELDPDLPKLFEDEEKWARESGMVEASTPQLNWGQMTEPRFLTSN